MLNQDILSLIKYSNISGVLINMTDLESSGGGYYPSFLIENGEMVRMLCPDIGDNVYKLLDTPPEQLYDNTWSLFMGDDGWTIVDLKTQQTFKSSL